VCCHVCVFFFFFFFFFFLLFCFCVFLCVRSECFEICFLHDGLVYVDEDFHS